MTLVIPTSAQMEALGLALGEIAQAGDVVVLTGELGAGKTTFARGFGEAFNLDTPVSSPTFIVARTHRSIDPEKPALVHVDAYRVGSAAEFDELDLDYSTSVVLAEWAAAYAPELFEKWVELILVRPQGTGEDFDEDQPREVSLIAHGDAPERSARYQAAMEHFRVSLD